MQGRITQVINMKPPEILSLIEEACGTSIYCQRRRTAQETIKKKELKIAETDRLLEQDIKPQFDKLENDKKNFDHFTELGAKITDKQRLSTAYEYSELLKVIEDKSSTKENLTADIANYQNRVEELTRQLEETQLRLREKIEAHQDKGAGQELRDSIKADTKEMEKLQNELDDLRQTVTNFNQLK